MIPILFLYSNLFLQHSVLLFSLFFLQLHPSSALQQTLCHDFDRSLLLQFKESLVFDTFLCDPSADSKLKSWKLGDDCCSWDGVECDRETGRVIGLDLSSCCLYGSINSTSPLFRLVRLTSLDLSSNNFNLSVIPGGIRSLSELEHLNLSSSNFYGQIPSEILELSELVSLDLSENPLILQKPGLKDVAETITNLIELHLSGVDISSGVPQSLSNLSSLSSLLLRNCSLQGEFPPDIFQLPNLRVLSLLYNPNLTGYLPEFRMGIPLETLRLDGTNFSRELPVSISKLESLRTFTASGCHFGGLIPSSIGNLTELEHLSLFGNNFSPGTLNWLGKLTNLQTLDLGDTKSYGAIPSSLQNLTRLEKLLLDSNQISGTIPSWVGNLTQLKIFQVSDNMLQGPIPESIFRLLNLQVLNLFNNNLTGSLRFDSFLQLQQLVMLQLTGNHLSLISSRYMNVTLPKFQVISVAGCNLREFPGFLRWQNEIEFLDLSRNKIKGYVPNWIFTLQNLDFLFLEINSLTGFEQPVSVLQRSNLGILNLTCNEFEGPLPIPPRSIGVYDVSNNNFNGEISLSFCNLTSAVAFDFSNNNLTGNFPECLKNFASVLDLRNNNLSGEIPDRFTAGCLFKFMDFSQNKFEGKVPRALANCSMLEILNLEENQMNDVFPSWLGVLPHLRVLSLRSNKFHGAIGKPLRESEFGQLQIIDLSDNYFTGELPLEYIRNWVAMKHVDDDQLAYMHTVTSYQVLGITWTSQYTYSIRIMNKGAERTYGILEFAVVVDLSSNRFEGKIPEIIGTLSELQSLNLSNNILTGHIPSTLGNLTKLEALDLSVNKLSGEIPIQLTLLTFLAVFNVSHNSLNGLIPQGNQFNTFNNDSFAANPGLCGHPVSRQCSNTKTLPLLPSDDEDADSPFEVAWEMVLIGFSSGLAIGVACGCTKDTKKYERIMKKKLARRKN